MNGLESSNHWQFRRCLASLVPTSVLVDGGIFHSRQEAQGQGIDTRRGRGL